MEGSVGSQTANPMPLQASSLTAGMLRCAELTKLDAMNWFELTTPLQINASHYCSHRDVCDMRNVVHCRDYRVQLSRVSHAKIPPCFTLPLC